MGAKDSKPSCISYEDAVKRVSDIEIRRIREAFKKSAGAGGNTLSKNAFLQDVLSEGVPPVLADWLYGACGGHQQRGIAFKELVCGLVLLTSGTVEEKIKFLWNVYCNESNTHIVKAEFTKALQIESTYQPADAQLILASTNSASGSPTHHQHSATTVPAPASSAPVVALSQTSILISLFGQADRVTYDQFRHWIDTHKKATVLSKWLLLESGVTQLSTELETPTFFQSLAGVTHLEEQDIADLETVFWTLRGAGQLDLETLGALVSPPIPWAALSGVFAAFDENRDGHIDFKELCCGVSAACRGPGVERSKFCFKVFDIDGDGVLSFSEIREMANILLFVACESNNSAAFRQMSVDSIMADLRGRANKTPTAEDSGEQQTGPFTFTQEDFMMWSIQSAVNLVQPFLDLLFEVCHVVLGLRPQCRHLEYDIVKGWLSRETARGYRIGQFWYLVSAEWYQNWLQYTQHSNASATCSFCKSSTNSNHHPASSSNHHQRHISAGGVDEAVVCDESFTSNSTESMGDLLGNASQSSHTGLNGNAASAAAADSSSLGSGSSGISLGGRSSSHSPPGIIDNSGLIDPSGYKNVQTLTGEGGRLKRDLILSQHRDYELLPKSLWDALALWYKGPLPLPRQVIQPPHQTEVELELYPLNIRILRHQNVSNALPAPIAQPVSSWGAVAGGYGAMSTSGGAGGSASGYGPSSLQPPKRYLAYTAAFSRLATVKQVGEFLCQRLKLKYEDIRLWHIYNVGEAGLLEEEGVTLAEMQIVDNDQFLLEIRNKDLTWPEELGSLGSSMSGGGGSQSTGGGHLDRRATLASIQSVHAPGATGLHNLGNTCFMNSALQVLFNTQPLAQYFRQNMHHYELNTTNKLGTKGQLALRYGELLREVWTASQRSVAPLKLRFCMTKHAPQFAGGGQHDSQELLEWLLDALHEDLNRVTEKPYAELKDSDGRPDEVVAAEAWQQHHARNQSIVTDLFYGQLKSKVSCLGCGRDSVRFDPFSLLSLPLPVENYTYCEVLVVLLDGAVPVKYGVRLNSDSRYADLKRELARLCGLHPTLMLVCELSDSQIRCALLDGQRLKASSATDLYVYEVPKGELWRRPRTSSELCIENGLKDIQRNPALLMSLADAANSNGAIVNNSNNNSTTVSSATLSSMASTSSDATGACVPLTLAMNGGGGDDADGDHQRHQHPLSASSSASLAASAAATATAAMPIGSRQTLSGAMGGAERSAKQPTELSTSPESTFIQMRRRSSGVGSNLLTLREANQRTNGGIDGHQNVQPRLYRNLDTSNAAHGMSLNRIAENGCASNGGDDDYDRDNDVLLQDDLNEEQQQPSSGAQSLRGGESGASFGGYLIAVHRMMSRQETYFLSYHKTRPSLFGVPLLIPCYEGGSNKDLYCAVWMQVARLLSPLPSTPPDQSNHATDCDDSLGYEFPFTLRAVTEGGRVCALCSWSKFCRGCQIPCNDEPLLRASQSSGPSSCSSTPKLSARSSVGDVSAAATTAAAAASAATNADSLNSRTASPTTTTAGANLGAGLYPFGVPPQSQTAAMHAVHSSAIHIAIDWDPTALHLRYQSNREKLWTEHESVAICRRQQTEPVDLDHCLRAFTSEEKLEQWYHCAHCKGKKPATKKLQIWRLPPILIVHLKRFNCVNNKWVKSQKVVNFPFKRFDPTPYLASVPQETILRHRELLEHQALQSLSVAAAAASQAPADRDIAELTDVDEADCAATAAKNDSIIGNGAAAAAKSAGVAPSAAVEPQPTSRRKSVCSPTRRSAGSGAAGGDAGGKSARRKRLVSTSLTQTPVIDGAFTDFHKHLLVDGQDPYDLNYQLYAVVSHSGMLNGGHYISYAANPNNAWYCYNDSSCREIPAQQPHIDPGSAYLLFYERKGLDYPPYLPKVDHRSMPNGFGGAGGGGGGGNNSSSGHNSSGAGSPNGGGGGLSGSAGQHSSANGGGNHSLGGAHGLSGLGPADLEDVDPEWRKTCTIS